MKVYKKLIDARIKLQATELTKSGHNKFAGYKYFELGDFLPAVQSIFQEVGLVDAISFTEDLATMVVYDVEDGSSVTFTSPMGSAQLKGCHMVQNIGAVETYQRRYLYTTALAIVEHDALDATTGKGTGRNKPTDSEIELPAEEKEYLREMAQEVTGLVQNGDAKAALNMVQAAGLEAEQHTFLWSQLDSSTRSAIKKAKEL